MPRHVTDLFFYTKYHLKSAEIILYAECKLLIILARDDLQVESSHFFHRRVAEGGKYLLGFLHYSVTVGDSSVVLQSSTV